ncbi:DegT/DnrJ/EryC1/StrS aminotransferase family protein [Hyphobacterium sp. HN65]|uniref:DegT/DnrJ/EryC1/StrS aminotransferase family protein n=1 Tax=Hyphobacterium lacteum TaxID=3116575 RepID=A0ABU7LPP0_9PROT|nr:DegT/DnrJ/EryC1/StrS aminotransferase family protein [Hyphobacterium sp. HN65]MEE2525878.1 DegT/DnrJ/EryC1/StrS aminotransferase family protein [Hyphobacterium sp. HN65]
MTTPVPFIDLAAQRERIREKLESSIASVIESGRYILGPEVKELEERLRDFGKAPHALACANGTDALVLPLMAWGLKPGDAVFVPSFTFASTAEVVPWLGATPVFIDVKPDTYCMDPESLSAAIEQVKADGKLNPRVVIAVDLFGQPANYPQISGIARKHGLKLIADSAQGFGCTLNGNHPIHWADVTTISFYPAKPLGGYGDGGALLCKDEELLKTIRCLATHGQSQTTYDYIRIGMNSRLDTIQAAVLLAKMDVFEDEIRTRNEAAARYADGFGDLVSPHHVIDGGVSVWAQYTIEVDNRDEFRKKLIDEGVPTAVYYPKPLHVQKPYTGFGRAPTGLHVTEAACERVVSLPMDGYLYGQRQDRVIAAVRKALGG